MKRKAPRKRAQPKKRPKARRTRPVTPAVELLPPGVLLSVNQAAAEFGNDRRTITKRIADLGIRPADERGGFAVYRLRDLLELERRNGRGETDPEKLPPYERLSFYKAESERLRVNLERGQLLRRDQVEQEWSRVLKLLAQQLDTLVDEIERDAGASKTVLELIDRKIDEMRERAYLGIVTHYEEVQPPEVPPDGDGSTPPTV